MPYNKYSPHGLHLYHASLPPRVVFNEEDEAKAKQRGYSEEYIPQEFPKAVTHSDATGEAHVTHIAQNRQHEKLLRAKPEAPPAE